ncbi:MAG: hypothetical protein RLZZ312_1311 [Bacteroidota bacterium]|jgi:hypothetical protein
MLETIMQRVAMHTNFRPIWIGHKNLVSIQKQMDVYTGFNCGLIDLSLRDYFYSPTSYYKKTSRTTEFSIGGQAGVRYFITKNIGVNFEVNAGMTHSNPFRAGISIAF